MQIHPWHQNHGMAHNVVSLPWDSSWRIAAENFSCSGKRSSSLSSDWFFSHGRNSSSRTAAENSSCSGKRSTLSSSSDSFQSDINWLMSLCLLMEKRALTSLSCSRWQWMWSISSCSHLTPDLETLQTRLALFTDCIDSSSCFFSGFSLIQPRTVPVQKLLTCFPFDRLRGPLSKPQCSGTPTSFWRPPQRGRGQNRFQLQRRPPPFSSSSPSQH